MCKRAESAVNAAKRQREAVGRHSRGLGTEGPRRVVSSSTMEEDADANVHEIERQAAIARPI